MKIIDNIYDLIDLTVDELDEKLLDPKYNMANLRELTRRAITEVAAAKRTAEMWKQKSEKSEKRFFALKRKIKGMVTDPNEEDDDDEIL